MTYSGTEIMTCTTTASEYQSHQEDPLLCGRLLQQEAAIFSQSPSTPPGCDVGYGEREFQRQLSASRLLLCFCLIMRIEIQWNSLFPLSMPYVTTLQYGEIFLHQWQPPDTVYGSDTAKQEFFMRLQLRLQSLHKHDVYIKSIVVLLLIIKHNNTSTSVFPSPLNKVTCNFQNIFSKIMLQHKFYDVGLKSC